jgi:hypothetical protein
VSLSTLSNTPGGRDAVRSLDNWEARYSDQKWAEAKLRIFTENIPDFSQSILATVRTVPGWVTTDYNQELVAVMQKRVQAFAKIPLLNLVLY